MNDIHGLNLIAVPQTGGGVWYWNCLCGRLAERPVDTPYECWSAWTSHMTDELPAEVPPTLDPKDARLLAFYYGEGEEECSADHHGYCQTHAITSMDENGQCGIARALKVLFEYYGEFTGEE